MTRVNAKEILEANREKVIAEYLAGKSTCKLGKELGVSNASVYVFLRDKCNIEPPKHNNKFADKEDEMVRLYNEGLSISKIAKQLDIPLTSANRYLKKLEKDTSRYQTNPEIPIRTHTEEILKMYSEGIGCSLIAQKFNTYDSTILKILHENNVEIRGPRQYEFDLDYFSKIDTQEKAYVLGWCFSDGYNSDDYLSIEITDLEPLEFIKEQLGHEVEIKETPKEEEHHLQKYRLRVHSRKMCEGLASLGCVRAKSLIVKFPGPEKVSTELMPHFLRGMFDGNGTLVHYFGRWHVSISSSDSFCEDAKQFLTNELGFYFGTTKDGNISKVQSGGIESIRAFLDYIYKDSTFKLDRKYQKYLDFLKSENQG